MKKLLFVFILLISIIGLTNCSFNKTIESKVDATIIDKKIEKEYYTFIVSSTGKSTFSVPTFHPKEYRLYLQYKDNENYIAVSEEIYNKYEINNKIEVILQEYFKNNGKKISSYFILIK